MTPEIRILLVEDSRADAELITRDLRRSQLPLTLRQVDNLSDFIKEITDAPPNLILTDFRLPNLDALEILNVLRERQLDTPVIVVTGTLTDEVAALCLQQGAVDYVLKDRLVRLPSAVQRALAEQKLRREREQALTALRESEERFRQIAESIDEVFWLTDITKTETIYVSPAYEKIWGRPCESVYRAPQSWLDAIHPEDREYVKRAALTSQVTDGYNLEYRIVRPDGALRWIHDRGFPVTDEEGKVYRIAGVAEDITERRQLEDQLRQAQKMEAIGQLAGGVAHDFNNLLTVITGHSQLAFAQLLAEDPLRYGLEQITKAAFRAASLTRQLLAFSRKQVLQPRVLSLNNIVSNIEGMLGRLIGEDIQLKTVLEPQLEPVKADPGQIEQVIFNLIGNARDAMPRGGIVSIETANILLDTEYCSTHQTVSPGWHVMLAVRDTGFGMDGNTLSHMFEPFFTTKEPGKGTGLGLATVYGIIKQSGGSISVDSEVGRGTTISVYLPRAEGPVEEVKSIDITSTASGSETILLVEDDEMVRELTADILKKKGYEVLEAREPYEALRISRQFDRPIHLMLTDVVMPQRSGPQLVEQIIPLHPDMKVLYMSGYAVHAIYRPGVFDPGVNFIEKPFGADALLQKIRQVLEPSGRPVTKPKGTILVVDDEPSVCALLGDLLRGEGYRVVSATDGVEAWRWMNLVACDLVITDMMLPYKDGLDLSIELRGKFPDLKIVAMSAAIDKLEDASINDRFDAILTKPFTKKELLAVIQALLEK
jgi:two-component system cell cycle sensor histidine kinase/response regulator CckA